MLPEWSKGQIRVTHRTSPSPRHKHPFTHFLFLLCLSESYPWHSSPDVTKLEIPLSYSQVSRCIHFKYAQISSTSLWILHTRTWFSFIWISTICARRPRVHAVRSAFWASFTFITEQYKEQEHSVCCMNRRNCLVMTLLALQPPLTLHQWQTS